MKQKKQLKVLIVTITLSLISTFFLFPFATNAFATTILLDPGHSAVSKGVYDDPYGIYDDDYPNHPEITEAMDIANWLNQKLTADGYKVIMTKSAWDTPSFVSLWDRAQMANNNNVDLAVSIHDDHTQSWGNFAQVYVQKDGLYRVNKSGKKITFNNSAVASKSQQYGQAIAAARTADEGHSVVVTDANFAGRAPIAPGNIPQVQLYSKVPWVYNEVGGTGIDISKYEKGILDGIEKAIPSNGASGDLTATSNCVITDVGSPKGQPTLPAACANGSESAVVQKVIALAKAHLKTGTYVLGTPTRNWSASGQNPPHFDCSGFVGWAWYWGSGGKVSMLGQTNADWGRSTSLYHKVVTHDESQLQPGDLIYFNNLMAEPQPGHVGLFVGHDTCGANDCYMQYYSDGLPGNELSLKAAEAGGWGQMMGFIRINVP